VLQLQPALWGQPWCWCGPRWKWVRHPWAEPSRYVFSFSQTFSSPLLQIETQDIWPLTDQTGSCGALFNPHCPPPPVRANWIHSTPANSWSEWMCQICVVSFPQWAAEKVWTASRWRRTSLRSTASPATARTTGPKATASGKELGLWTLTPLDAESWRLKTGAHAAARHTSLSIYPPPPYLSWNKTLITGIKTS